MGMSVGMWVCGCVSVHGFVDKSVCMHVYGYVCMCLCVFVCVCSCACVRDYA